VGQALGARDPDRAERSVWIAGFLNLLYLSAAGAVFALATPGIVQLFGGDGATREFAVRALRTLALGFPFYAYGMVVGSAFNGAGDTWTPTLINLGCFWVWELPMAWLLAHGGSGAQGINLAATSAFCAVALMGVAVFRLGRWKRIRV